MLINLIKTSTNFVGKDGKGVNFYTGSMQLQDLYDKYIVQVYRVNRDISDLESGYQRNVQKNGVNAIDDRIYKKTMDQLQDPFVDNINLNMRKNDTEKHVRPLVKGKDKYGDFFEFEYNEDHFGKFFVVDGQTRLQGGIAAYKRAQDAGDNEARDKIGSINVHFTLTFCVDIYKEAYLFYLINHHVKKIPPEAAITLIEQGHGKKHVLFSNDIIVDEKKNMISTVIELQKK